MKKLLFILTKCFLALVFAIMAIVVCYIYWSQQNIPPNEYTKLKYGALPQEVKKIYSQQAGILLEDRAFYCQSTDPNCGCKIVGETVWPFPVGLLIITDCHGSHKVNFGMTSLRFFVINGNEIYFPVYNTISIDSKALFSDVVKTDSCMYGRVVKSQ